MAAAVCDGKLGTPDVVAEDAFVAWVAEQEHDNHPRWIVRSLRAFYPPLLDLGVRLRRAHDLMLCHAILRDTQALPEPLAAQTGWMRSDAVEAVAPQPALFDLESGRGEQSHNSFDEVRREWERQRSALETASDGRLELLCLAESTGALVAEEMTAAGVPWRRDAHEEVLSRELGARPLTGARPPHMAELADQIAIALDDRTVNPDSPPKLLRALHRAGVFVASTSRWELEREAHPVVQPLLRYKQLSRLFTANGWAWLDEWVRGGRFRPVFVPGGVVTGRWSSSGGGALQIPRLLRTAVRADEGWMLVQADVAQLEPRVLAAMSRDSAMATAARGADLYEGIVRSGAVATRDEAKYAVLGAMYGATTGESGRLVPRLRRAFPQAMSLVDEAARIGEDGGVVSTMLGRGSPAPDEDWRRAQALASDPGVDPGHERAARASARERGRFTRNFVVQGTAAEWALLWLAEIRHRLGALPPASVSAPAAGRAFSERAHLVFFLHDEVLVHAPGDQADSVATLLQDAADAATARLFPGFAIDVPLDVRVGIDAGKDL